MCFFGDGTTNIGAFHEAVNLAAVWNLPVVFVCENNLYMEYTPISAVIRSRVPRRRPGRRPTDSIRIIVDGNDADAVYVMATARLSSGPAAGEGPSLVEALTYRHKGHSRADPGKYRPDDEVAVVDGSRSDRPSTAARLEAMGIDPPPILDDDRGGSPGRDRCRHVQAAQARPPNPDLIR